jgi:hypothetical protein
LDEKEKFIIDISESFKQFEEIQKTKEATFINEKYKYL